ncbi:UNKNOWN [Stylonychia lemnae]|uniref:F5/8 type C domain-containing protein n=1 Tax=Stylonychia lemnae TaxID=5949 RepID=A0A078AZQ6_STYLE|nr:UNKNOWN [Stylonychia lemnae]|eukprot:CDW87581.1 UNKNOWN [Stylonychia lemnae]
MEVKCATSFDERFDPNNVLNKDSKKFWVTTGLYPHELLIDLGGTKPINEIKFISTGARKIVIEGCKTTNASEFKKVGESKELMNKTGIQNETVRLTDAAPYCLIKFTIQEGWDDFTSVHNIDFN